jgi:hypothetical protein
LCLVPELEKLTGNYSKIVTKKIIKEPIYSHGMVNISNILNKGKSELPDIDPVKICIIIIVTEILSYLLAS